MLLSIVHINTIRVTHDLPEHLPQIHMKEIE
jgi:hypothetical protein